MKTKHTQGEWSESRKGHIKSGDNAETWQGVCQILGNGKEAEANVKIIKAAPFMLETLIDMVEMESTPAYIKRYAKEAIKKATD